MNKIVPIISSAFIAFTLTLFLTSCGADNTEVERRIDTDVTMQSEVIPAITNHTEWTTQTDPVTGKEFRCLTAAIKISRDAGLGIWCYESNGQ
jgi:hypothetical protein